MSSEFPQPFGPYELLRPLGRGGMAEVFLAQARTAAGEQRAVALKRMHASLSEDVDAVEMLVSEAQLAMRFDHPNIARTYELGKHGATYFFLMEFVDGLDLGSLAGIAARAGERLDPVAVAWIVRAVARALDHAHSLRNADGQLFGIVHRDVSPQNVLISKRGQVKLIDFGVAKVETRIQQTVAGVIKGKYAYMSPEQASAEPVDGRSDVFSLGICMHELLTGKALFRSKNAASPFAILRAVREAPIQPPAIVEGVPSELSALCMQALQRPVDDRYAGAAAFAEALDLWLAGNGVGFDEGALSRYVRALLSRAPREALPPSALQTPPSKAMTDAEFAPSELSVVARSPLEAARERQAAARKQAAQQSAAPAAALGAPTEPEPAVARRTQRDAQAAPAEAAPTLESAPSAPHPTATPIVGDRAAPRTSQGSGLRRPSRRTVKQLLWVGLMAFVFVLGWSVVATLKRLGHV